MRFAVDPRADCIAPCLKTRLVRVHGRRALSLRVLGAAGRLPATQHPGAGLSEPRTLRTPLYLRLDAVSVR